MQGYLIYHFSAVYNSLRIPSFNETTVYTNMGIPFVLHPCPYPCLSLTDPLPFSLL